MLKQGDQAPLFELPVEDGSVLSLQSLQGRAVVVYFYPKDNTSGCTIEAVDFTQLLDEFTEAGIKIIGISPDSVKKHVNFIKKHDLKITLGADEDKAVAMAYGVWQEKKMYGRTYMGIVRSTFLVDKSGTIAQIWRKVRVKEHAAKVLAAAQELAQG